MFTSSFATLIMAAILITSIITAVTTTIAVGGQQQQQQQAPLDSLERQVPRPNGQIAFDRNRDGNDEVYVMNSNGGEQTIDI